MFVLKNFPKLYFGIIKVINICFFGFIVYLTFVRHTVDLFLYISILFSYGILLLFHFVGSYMNEQSEDIIEESYYLEMFEDDFDEEL